MKRLTILLLILAIVLLSCDNNVHRKNFRVTFDNCFGTITYEAVNEGEAVARPADPTGDSSVGKFKAWVTDKNKPDETEYNFSTIVTKDITLYAHYYGLKTVTLQKPNGEKWKDISVSYGSPLSIEEDEIDGSIIESWLLDNKEYDTTKPVTTDITLKAKCYKTVEKDSEQYRQILGLMKLSQLFIEASDIDETNETIDGLTKETLIKLLLAHSKLIDTKTANTMSYYYNKNGTNYNFCESYMNYKEFENILYANIYKDNTYIKGYKSKEYSDGSTKVIVSAMNVNALFAKGKYDEDKKTIISDDSTEDNQMLLLSSIIVDSDKNKNIAMQFYEPNSNMLRIFERHNSYTNEETIATLIMKNAGNSGTNPEDYATKISFCTVTFDEGNGTTYSREILKGNKVYEPKNIPAPSSGKTLFKCWSLDGKAYDFSSPVNKNITLKAEYLNESEYEKAIEAECIYNIATILSGFDKLANGEKNPANLTEEFESKQSELAKVLLCAKENMNKDEKLYFAYKGINYIFPSESGSKIDAYLDTTTEHTNLKDNKSAKSSDSTALDINTFAIHMKYYIEDTKEYYYDSVTFSFKAEIKDNVTKATLIKDGKTYPEVTVTKSDNKIKYEIEDLTYVKSIK